MDGKQPIVQMELKKKRRKNSKRRSCLQKSVSFRNTKKKPFSGKYILKSKMDRPNKTISSAWLSSNKMKCTCSELIISPGRL